MSAVIPPVRRLESYVVEPVDDATFRFDLPLDQPIHILTNELEHHLPADYFREIQQSESHSIIKPSFDFHGDIQHHVLKILKNEKEGGSEDGLHGRDGGILGIISLLSGLDSNRNITCSSTLKRKRVDVHVHEVPIVLMEEKYNKYDLTIAKNELKTKFSWPPHYCDLPFIIAIAVAYDIISFNKLNRARQLTNEFQMDLSKGKQAAFR